MKSKKPENKSIEVSAIKCDKCNDIVFSRARHDCRSCSCDDVFIDGGRDYKRVGFHGNIGPEPILLKINGFDSKDLYEDWAKAYDKMGLIKINELPDYMEIIPFEFEG